MTNIRNISLHTVIVLIIQQRKKNRHLKQVNLLVFFRIEIPTLHVDRIKTILKGALYVGDHPSIQLTNIRIIAGGNDPRLFCGNMRAGFGSDVCVVCSRQLQSRPGDFHPFFFGYHQGYLKIFNTSNHHIDGRYPFVPVQWVVNGLNSGSNKIT